MSPLIKSILSTRAGYGLTLLRIVVGIIFAAHGSQIKRAGTRPVTLLGEQVLLIRANDVAVSALRDFCPHRGAPLSLGYVENGNLVCGYHGLVMGCDGKTVSMPAQRTHGFPCNKAYAAIEKFGFIWVWPGEKALADESKLPTLEWAEHPEWSYGGGLFHIQCDYRLMVDNLMDLTHETYVHSSSIGQKEIDEALPVTKVDGDHVITERYMENVIAPPFWQMALRCNNLADDVSVDRWQRCHFVPPSNVHIEVGVAHAGHGGYHAPKDKKVKLAFIGVGLRGRNHVEQAYFAI